MKLGYLALLSLLISTQLVSMQLKPTQGSIVFLKGTASAGKSSICQELSNLEKWHIISEDDYWLDIVAKSISDQFPSEFPHIKKAIHENNIPHAIVRDEILFRPTITDSEKEAALKAINYIRHSLDSTQVLFFKNRKIK